MAMSAVAGVPQKARWLSASARLAVRKTGSVVAGVLLDHYRTTLQQIRETGYVRYAVEQFRPYLLAAASQFSRRRQSLTERLLSMAAQRKAGAGKRSRKSGKEQKSLRLRRPRPRSNLK